MYVTDFALAENSHLFPELFGLIQSLHPVQSLHSGLVQSLHSDLVQSKSLSVEACLNFDNSFTQCLRES